MLLLKKGLRLIAQLESGNRLCGRKLELTIQLKEIHAARAYTERLLQSMHDLEASTDNNLSKYTMSDGYSLPNVQSIQQRLIMQDSQIEKLKTQLATADVELARIKSHTN